MKNALLPLLCVLHLSIVAKPVEFRITFRNAAASIPFNQTAVPDNQLEYEIIFEIDSDNNPNTGVSGADVIVDLRHVKLPNSTPFTGSYADFSQQRLIIPTDSGNDIYPIESISVIGNELVFSIDNDDPLVQNVSSGDPFRVYSLLWDSATDQFHFDNTPLPLPTVGTALTDEAGDLAVSFMDFTAASVVTEDTGVSNDNLCSAIEIVMDQSCQQVAYSNEGTSLESSEPLPDNCEFTNTGTSWFSLQVPATDNYNIQLENSEGVNRAVNVRLFQTTENFDCGNYTGLESMQSNCSESQTSVSFNASMTADVVYYLQVITEDDDSQSFCVAMQQMALPLELVAFKGKTNLHNNEISWTVQSEQAVAYYQVERSTTGAEKWEAVGQPLTTRNRSQKTTYEIVDPQPFPATYYRLKTVANDTQTSYSDVLLLKKPTPTALKLYPNPTQEQLNIKWNHTSSSPISIHIHSATGAEVFYKKMPPQINTASHVISTKSLPVGVYWLTLTTNKENWQQSFVKSDF